jgi:hypothetical protein
MDRVLLTVKGVRNEAVEEGQHPPDQVKDRLKDGAKEVAYGVHERWLLAL